MVYCGKPSEACEQCRLKRRKCDLKKPSCSQCVRAQVACPGYRDTSSVYFRNESQSVARKVQQKRTKTRLPIRRCLPTTIRRDSGRSQLCGDFSRIVHLPLHLEDVAVAHFMMFYAPTGPLAYVPSFWNSLASNQNVMLAMHAAAIASFATNLQYPELKAASREYYSKALTQTSKALNDPRLAVLDGTLLTVLLLCSFEALTFRGRQSPQSWTAHAQGAVALLTLRGDQQLESELGRHLFHHAGMIIRISCAQRSVPVPPELTRLQERATSVLETGSRGYKLSMLLDGITRLSAGLEDNDLATNIVREALYLDNEAATVFEALEAKMPYQIIKSATGSADAFAFPIHKGQYHQYESQNAARLWNIFRMLRLLLNEWIFSYSSQQHGIRGVIVDKPLPDDPLYLEWDRLPSKAALQAEDMIDDIVASVPFSFDLLEEESKAPARYLIWPLATVGTSKICSISTKLFVINRLKAIGKQYNLSQAKEAASMLEEGVELEDWLHLIHFS